jgi:arylsulfatase A-like enzyme
VHDPYTPQPPYDTWFAEDYQGPISSDREFLLGQTDEETFNELRDVFWSQVDPTRSEDIEHLKALYDGQIREIDARVGELIQAALEADERTVIVLVSDHGEEFHEHGKFLHDQLYEELLKVPLILKLPSGGRGRVEERVSLIDLAPTLLDVIGLEAPTQFQGSSLVPVLQGVEGRPLVYGEKVVQLSEDDGETELGGQGIRAALISDDWKVIAARTEELYYLPDDLQEQNNLASQSPEMSGLLELLADVNRRNAALRKELGTGLGDKQGLDEETLEELEALGYLGN